MLAEVAEITVQKIWPPFDDAKPWKDGKRRGKIVSSEGDTFHVAETMLREFSLNHVCKVEYKTFGNNKENPAKEIIKKIWTGDPAPVPKQITRQRTNPTDRNDILVAVLLKEPRFDDMPTTQIVQLILKHKEVARLTSGETQRRDDLNDEIPDWPAPNSENPAD